MTVGADFTFKFLNTTSKHTAEVKPKCASHHQLDDTGEQWQALGGGHRHVQNLQAQMAVLSALLGF